MRLSEQCWISYTWRIVKNWPLLTSQVRHLYCQEIGIGASLSRLTCSAFVSILALCFACCSLTRDCRQRCIYTTVQLFPPFHFCYGTVVTAKLNHFCRSSFYTPSSSSNICLGRTAHDWVAVRQVSTFGILSHFEYSNQKNESKFLKQNTFLLEMCHFVTIELSWLRNEDFIWKTKWMASCVSYTIFSHFGYQMQL